MRRRCLVLVIALTGCASSVAGEGQRSAYSPAEVAGWTADGDLPGVLAVEDLPTTHVSDPVAYDQSPPLGGPHDAMWADCTGIAYAEAIREENAVHSLEHGAVWLAYDPALPAEDVAVLAGLMDGIGHTMLSPYPGLSTAVSVQSWGRQLVVESVSDPRLEAFLWIYRMNPELSPEPGATCSNPAFASDPLPPE